jgi:bile acid:Na+ symporter, BASS family
MKSFYRLCTVINILSALAIVAMLVTGYRSEIGPFAILFVIALALSFRGMPATKGYSFTVWIMVGVTIAMFYPQYIVKIHGFETKNLIIPLMQIIMFGMGTTQSIQNFIDVFKMPYAVLAGIIAQFSIMPLVGFTLAIIAMNYFNVSKEIAAGIILIGCSPCGLASDVMNYIARNNLALSITLTSSATIIAPVVTPLLMKLFAGTMVPIAFVPMMLTIIKIIILPVIAGLTFHHLAHGKAKWLDRSLPVLSMIGIATIITVITAAGREGLMKVGVLLVFAAIIHNGLGYFFGYWLCRLVFRLDRRSCRTVAIEVGLQNGGLASGIALEMGKIETMGLFSAVFGPWMNVSGSSLANWWRGHPLDEVKKNEESSTHETGKGEHGA